MSEENLGQAVAAIRAGDKERGKQLLLQFLETDDSNDDAWMWLSVCVADPDLKRECYNRALEINPSNEQAQKGLRRLDTLGKVKSSKAKKRRKKPSKQVSSGIKECPKCTETIKARATVCRHCGYDFKKARTKKIRSAVMAACALVLCVCCASMFRGLDSTSPVPTLRPGEPTRTPRPAREYEPDKWDAYTYCQEFVERNLTAPSTASNSHFGMKVS